MEFAGQRLALQHLDQVWHIGSLNPADRGCHGHSFEGTGLSISVNPDAWEQIAKLGGLLWWELKRPHGAFLDYLALTEQQLAELTLWGVREGWLVMRQQWELSWLDSEDNERRMCYFDSLEKAQYERDEEDDTVSLKEVVRPCPTKAMDDRLGFKADVGSALDLAATFWVEDMTSLDGVWWAEYLRPSSLSAPRGVIVRRALDRWSQTCVR